jgi:hypothetical protein
MRVYTPKIKRVRKMIFRIFKLLIFTAVEVMGEVYPKYGSKNTDK